MNLYLISQDVNTDYDTYDAAVVAAETEEEARNISPRGYISLSTWAPVEKVQVELIGKAIKGTEVGIILASFNAG
jgi:hypothetical protein